MGGHSHSHTHGAVDEAHLGAHRQRLAIAFGITASLLVAQAVGAVWTGSLALLTDTAHMLTDTAGLAVALGASVLAGRPPSPSRTWGFRRVEVLAALAQASILLAVGIFAAIEGARRLWEPPEMASAELLLFGVLGLIGNVVSMWVLAGGRKANLATRGAFLEVVNDALGSIGVIVAAVVIALTGWQQADAVAGLVIAGLIVPRALVLLRDATHILMEFTPRGLDLDEVRTHLLDVRHVRGVHDLHASTVASGLPVLTAHVVVDGECFTDGHAPEILRELQTCVAEHFPVTVSHSTFQVESAGCETWEERGLD
ncbi:cation diffusion facilitator family transporter [Propionicicella superfundia]|uniref:cation diffusion facilitator family transporter n=1 Tax=Propionicicella superfundia TaxID=348582 RepID=UPI0004167FB4|nr:cation diffusion facilitator family transporter [Propionicicella superfundia]